MAVAKQKARRRTRRPRKTAAAKPNQGLFTGAAVVSQSFRRSGIPRCRCGHPAMIGEMHCYECGRGD